MSKIINLKPQGTPWYEIRQLTKNEADVYIYDEIGFWGVRAADFAQELSELDVDSINLRLNSPGGSVFEGLGIYNTLKNHKASVTVHIDGLAASIASVIAMAGDEIRIAENAMLMIHRPYALALGNSTELRQEADLLDKIQEQIVNTYTARTGMSAEEVNVLVDAETWMSGEEAKEFGFADKVTESKKAAASVNQWDLSLFDKAPHKESDEESNTVTPLSLLIRKQALTEQITTQK
jgi:ATP-dependent Clp endopeptidase proteolytic subunit ClpP